VIDTISSLLENDYTASRKADIAAIQSLREEQISIKKLVADAYKLTGDTALVSKVTGFSFTEADINRLYGELASTGKTEKWGFANRLASMDVQIHIEDIKPEFTAGLVKEYGDDHGNLRVQKAFWENIGNRIKLSKIRSYLGENYSYFKDCQIYGVD
ncbi:hypothetical protein KY345_00590, partial [Candidatus Woesearchaeota archaeon]|nr:hypothetical protein [Candidatus Woesearchaeota archaeon]